MSYYSILQGLRQSKALKRKLHVSDVGLQTMMMLAWLNELEVDRDEHKLTRLDVSTATVTQVADDLERAGLAVRERHPNDRRVWLLYLSPKGAMLAAKLVAQVGGDEP